MKLLMSVLLARFSQTYKFLAQRGLQPAVTAAVTTVVDWRLVVIGNLLRCLTAVGGHNVQLAGLFGNQQIVIAVPAERCLLILCGDLFFISCGAVAKEESIFAVTLLGPEGLLAGWRQQEGRIERIKEGLLGKVAGVFYTAVFVLVEARFIAIVKRQVQLG